MGEILDGPVQGTARVARERLTRAVHDLDPRKKEASVTLFRMREAMREVPITRLPRALEITIGGRNYVSTRVMDGPQLQIETLPPQEPNGWEIVRILIPAKFIPEGNHALLFTPSLYGAVPKSEELLGYIEQLPNGRKIVEQLRAGVLLPEISPRVYGNLLPHVLASGRKFDFTEWDFDALPDSTKETEMFVRLKGKILKPGLVPRGFLPNSPAVVTALEEIKPNKEGDLIAYEYDQFFFVSSPEPRVLTKLSRRMARFYVLVEGSTDKEKSRQDHPLKRLFPQEAPAHS